MLAAEYAREALKNGLALEQTFGTNPYKLGIVGGTDSHTSLPTAEEDNFFGKHTGYEPSPERLTYTFLKTENGEIFSWQQAASGYTAVWARENTPVPLFSMRWTARKSMPPLARASWCVSLAVGTFPMPI